MKENQEINESKRLGNDLRWFCSPDCPGHLIGEGACETPPQLTKPKAIIFLIHGMNGSADSFSGFRNAIRYTSFSQSVVQLNLVVNHNTSSETLRSELFMLDRRITAHKYLLVSVDFSNNRDWVANQVEELRIIITRLKNIYGYGIKFAAAAHSKGGLVVTDYVAKYRDLSALVTLGTPYNNGGIIDLANPILDKTVGNETDMKRIKDGWNSIPSSQVPPIFALATAYKFAELILYTGLIDRGFYKEAEELYENLDSWADMVVKVPNAKGNGYQKVNPIVLDKKFNDNYEHSRMLTQPDVVQITFQKLDQSL